MKSNKHFYTNGYKTIKLADTDLIPGGFYKGRTFNANPQNKGLDKSDPRVALNGRHTRQTRLKNDSYHSQNKGLTKETSPSLQLVSEHTSATRRQKHITAWNKGIPASEERKQKQSKKMLCVAANKTAEEKKAAQEKSNQTKLKNKSFNTSKPEELLYEELQIKYGRDNVLRQYNNDLRYPYNCDFYIPSEDLFIELNQYQMHNDHPFNSESIEDQEQLSRQKEKAITMKSYEIAIDVQTNRDVKKLNTARDNNLNFIFIYPKVTICK